MFYLFLFFNFELLVVFCFFFFLLFLFLADLPLLSSLLSLSSSSRSLFSRLLSSRSLSARHLSLFLHRSLSSSSLILFSFFFSCSDLFFALQHVSLLFCSSLLSLHVRSFLDVISSRSSFLSFHIKLYLTRHLFSLSFSPSSSLFRLL